METNTIMIKVRL